MTRPNRTTRSNSALGLNAALATIRHALITWALLLGLVWLPIWAAFSWGHINRQTTAYERHVVMKWAEAVAWVDGLDLPTRPISYGIDGAMFQAAAGDFARAPQVLAIRDAAWTRVRARIWLSAGLAFLIVLCIRYMLGLFGQGIRGDAYLRGGWLTSPGDLRRLIRRAGPLSRFQLGKIRLSQESECQHLQIEGTPGTGKTVALRQLLGSIGRRWPAIIYDTKGEFLAESYDAERDVVLNPLDVRCPDWTPWNEILSPTDAWRVAKAMVASQGPNDGFWIEAARQLLADFLLSVADDRRTNAELYRLCTVADTDELKTLLKGTPSGRLFADPGAERMRESVRNTLVTSVRGLQLLQPEAKAGDGFSITQWVRTSVDGKGEAPRVFLFSPPDHAPAIAPIIAVWIESASAAVLGLRPSRTRRILFAIDELPTLPPLEYLLRLAAEGRGYGASIVVATQSQAQLRQRYGVDGATAFSALFSTRVIFRAADHESAELASKLLGDEEIDIARETEGAAARSNHSVSSDQRMRRLITATEILQLPNLQCFLRVAGDFPIARLTLKVQGAPVVAPAYAPRDSATLVYRPNASPAAAPRTVTDDRGPI